MIVIEKRQEIGTPKRCGEGLPLTATEIIKLGVPPYVIRQPINGAIVYAPSGKDVIIKYQLFMDVPPNKSLKRDVFMKAYNYAVNKDLLVTASVFDVDSLRFLQKFDIPFIKLANNHACRKLAGGIHEVSILWRD